MNYVYTIATINLNSSNTKANKGLLKDFINNHDIDVIFLQEVSYEDFSFIYTHHSLVNISSDKKGTAILIRKSLTYSDSVLDLSGRITSVVINNVNMINIYAHSGNNMRKEREHLFTEALTIHLNKPNSTSTLIGGDFNCVLEARDTKGPPNNLSNSLKSVVDLLGLQDIAKMRKANQFTFFRGNSASRLDRFYAPAGLLENVTCCSTHPLAFSDHHSVIIKMRYKDNQLSTRGRGYWKINPTLLSKDDVSNRFKQEYLKLQQRHAYTQDLNLWWNFHFKKKVKIFYKGESWQLNESNRNC